MISAGVPSYEFKPGDSVEVGHLEYCQVDDVLFDSKVYGIRYGAEGVNYTYRLWYEVRPIPTEKECQFADRNSVFHKMRYTTRTVTSLLDMVYSAGVNMIPAYQRGSVWDDGDREKLLDSLFVGRNIGQIVLRILDWEKCDDAMYELVDGKQRLLTLCAVFENRVSYHGKFFNDWTAEDRARFLTFSVSVAELPEEVTDKEVLKTFLALNENGKAIEEEVLDHARKMLEAINNIV